MSKWKQPNIFNQNKGNLNGCILIMETDKCEGEDFLFYSYKTNESCKKMVDLKGIILASTGISNSVFGDDIKVMIISEQSEKQEKYKVAAKSYMKNHLISVVLPAITPDNILLYVLKEYINFLEFFFQSYTESKQHFPLLDKFAETIFLSVVNFSLPSKKIDLEGSLISNMPTMAALFNYNESFPCYLVKPPMNDNLRSEIIEIMNQLSSDHSVIQESMTLIDPPFYLKGYCLLFKGFVLFNSVNNAEMSNLARLSMMHSLSQRNQSDSELLTCEFIFEQETMGNSSFCNNTDEKKKVLALILAQREFVLCISLEILGKNNSSFDPFYQKRAEDLLTSVLKKGYTSIVKSELHANSVRLVAEPINDEEKVLHDYESSGKNTRRSLARNAEHNNMVVNILNSKIKGFIDQETQVNIIHFSCYDDCEILINSTELNVSANLYWEIYHHVFREYARIQSNINKLKKINSNKKLSSMFDYESIAINYTSTLRKEANIKTKTQREIYLKHLKPNKIDEYAYKFFTNETNVPIWICCKIYEHTTIEDEANLDEFGNFKIIFVAYESLYPVEIDSFCQDLLINELFI